ncbi:hypothetical protein HMPREF1870_01111 [Bacteroidales bacterium KA00344]|nr:hypothetical protein HMPREF1870_01111 [Bacteroidales bacterium KA00344]
MEKFGFRPVIISQYVKYDYHFSMIIFGATSAKRAMFPSSLSLLAA